MQITETVTRECCQPIDWRPVHGTPTMANGLPMWQFCRHCGHRQRGVVDETGDWRYVDAGVPWARARRHEGLED
jgi:hypothetical protein